MDDGSLLNYQTGLPRNERRDAREWQTEFKWITARVILDRCTSLFNFLPSLSLSSYSKSSISRRGETVTYVVPSGLRRTKSLANFRIFWERQGFFVPGSSDEEYRKKERDGAGGDRCENPFDGNSGAVMLCGSRTQHL